MEFNYLHFHGFRPKLKHVKVRSIRVHQSQIQISKGLTVRLLVFIVYILFLNWKYIKFMSIL